MKTTDMTVHFWKQRFKFSKVFGYSFIVPLNILTGSTTLQTELDQLIEKSIKDRTDYVADFLGYDIEKEKAEAEEQRKSPVFYD